MYDPLNTPPPQRMRVGLKVALVGAGLAAGVIGATAVAASAQSSSSPSASTTTAAAPQSGSANAPGRPGNGPAGGHGGSAPVRNDEKSVSAADAATLKAAALKAVPGATVYRVETDAGDGEYEVHLTKSDGTLATVKFDKNLKVTKVETGMGSGDPAPAGQPH